MILELYLSLTAICFFLLIIGYWTDSIICITVGWGLVFIVNTSILSDGVEYHSGDTIIKNDTTITVSKNYEAYNSKIGFYMLVLGLFGSTYSLYEYYSRGKREDE